MSNLIDKNSLSAPIAEVLEVDPARARCILTAILDTIKGALLRGEKVYVKGFGTFKIVSRTPRRTSNYYITKTLKTDKVTAHPPRRYVVFEPSIPLLAMLNMDSPTAKERRSIRRWELA